MSFGLVFETIKNGFSDSIAADQKRIRAAATAAIKQTAIVAVDNGRQEIRSAGLPGQFVSGYHYKIDTKNGVPSAFISDKLGFISIFEEGQTISGKPLLWLPLSNLPQSVTSKFSSGVRNKLSIKGLAKIGPIHSINVPGKAPMLGVEIRDNSATPRVTVSKLRRGRNAKKGILRVVPIFVGVPVANIKKRMNLKQVVRNAAALLPLFYAKNMQE